MQGQVLIQNCILGRPKLSDCALSRVWLVDMQAVESPCLSILVPLLVKGLREKAPVVRKTAVIIDNMVKVRLKLSPRTSPSADEL